MKRLQFATMVALTTLLTCAVGHAAEYFLSPSGADANPGTREAPWQTLEKASAEAQAGDTVTLLPGRYEGRLEPVNSGTPEAPIVFRAEPRLEARLVGTGDAGVAVRVADISHLRFEGLHISPWPDPGNWVYMRGTSHITFEDCLMEDSRGGLSIHFEECEQIFVRDNIMHRRHRGGDMFRLTDCNHVVIEGNTISRAAHSPFNLRPDHGGRFIVVRGNVFHAAWGRNFEFFGSQDVLFEHNIVTHAFNSGFSGSANSKFATTRGIFRFNRVFHNPHQPFHLYQFRDVWLDTMRFYNNVFDNNTQAAMAISSSGDQVRDLLFFNNIFSRNDHFGRERQLHLRRGTTEQVRLVRNAFRGSEPGLPVIEDYNGIFSIEELQSEDFQAEHGLRYLENLDVDPGFVNAAIYDHALREDSPLRNAGMALTCAASSGEGMLLGVEDTVPFYDGFGIEGEHGDLIAVGASDQRARILAIDHEAGTMLLDRALSWTEGDPVSLPWSGDAPDLGVYEHGDVGRVSVQVIADPFEARPGQQVALRTVVHGEAEVAQIRWCFGDGNIAEGAEATHTWDDEYDYAIRVRVTDAEGRRHYGAGYILIAEPVDPSEPLIHSTWDADDHDSWWLWKTYRPRPVTFRDIVDRETGEGYRHIVAEEDRARLPAQINPIGWDVDLYPRVLIRYRMGEGSPLAVTLTTFSGAVGVIAASPGAEVDQERRVADYVLQDDGEWHDLEFDARVIREIEPDLQMLARLYIIDWPRDAVREGHYVDLDEVIIGPAQ